jgi:DNA repair protein RecN (Recombination protein N)
VRQVLCVTHQPQIAVYAARQLKVDKKRSGDTTRVQVECLDGQRRVDELAMMLRGEAASAHTRAEVAAMLQEAQCAAVSGRQK